MGSSDALRTQLVQVLAWRGAHVDFDTAVRGIPARLRGTVPDGWEHSAWQLVEHIRRAQADILEFCTSRKYREKRWPEDYWPASARPSDASSWRKTLQAYRRDLRAAQRLAARPSVDLLAPVPHGDGQTYLREILLVVDHTAYHVGQIVALRRRLGIWNRQ